MAQKRRATLQLPKTNLAAASRCSPLVFTYHVLICLEELFKAFLKIGQTRALMLIKQ
jgi:hypothetical protein